MKIYPFFIKPKKEVKEFTGFVLDKKSTLSDIGLYYSQIKPESEVYVSEPINIVSEWRVFIHKDEVVGIKHYSGDFRLFPNFNDIDEMKMNYINSPVSYTLDIGIVADTKEESYTVQLDDCCTVGRKKTTTTYNTILIEVNDFWAIGGYGLDGKTYTRMIIDRFREITPINKNNDKN